MSGEVVRLTHLRRIFPRSVWFGGEADFSPRLHSMETRNK